MDIIEILVYIVIVITAYVIGYSNGLSSKKKFDLKDYVSKDDIVKCFDVLGGWYNFMYNGIEISNPDGDHYFYPSKKVNEVIDRINKLLRGEGID